MVPDDLLLKIKLMLKKEMAKEDGLFIGTKIETTAIETERVEDKKEFTEAFEEKAAIEEVIKEQQSEPVEEPQSKRSKHI